MEASSRYSISRTALELLYLPLPTELKNRTKAFVDVFVDRLGRGVAALLLLLLTAMGLATGRPLSLLILVFAAAWIALAVTARNEYTATVRRRVESRRLDLEGARITVQDTETVRLLEQAARGANERQVIYAVSLLAEAPNYDLSPLLDELAGSESGTVRAKVYGLARETRNPGLLDRALAEIRAGEGLRESTAAEAVTYAMGISRDAEELAREFIEHPNAAVGEAALGALAADRKRAQAIVSRDWLQAASVDERAERRALAAFAVGIRGDEGTDALHRLLRDGSPVVVEAACRSAGRLKNPDYFREVVDLLADPDVRGRAAEALTAYGADVVDPLGELLRSPATPLAIRQRMPRVLSGIPTQRSVDVLSRSIGEPDLVIRSAVLKALGHLRNHESDLDYGDSQVREQIHSEARSYFTLYAALARFREVEPGGKATALLARTIDERLDQTIERLFRLLGLRYPPKQIQAAYLAVSHKRSEEFAAALEFLDNILDHDLRSILLPMIDGSPHLLDIGDEHFGVKVPSLESALLQQLNLQDSWLTACAIAAAGELKLRSMKDQVRAIADSGDAVLAPVAREAAAALA
jgi:AAA family ATP:ADP antiporter